ncbi:unnamed protein product [Didymodactylos carnosus]|uniref:Uncharacterized protein n=1 Tax=Didymodactylos carnosus TaxID=1234261 RepID=A0A815E6Z1_9BILA|nr:unnamed protein product [Didymodactylos carnosus]CAF1586608.1 unnamed protein product [Didymodactylos carnosus]CAF4143785.1 unnamed protein product [Didymodactylos carnosus]CAF4388299.1 unnamed protein product [Didymodactylos carnosus]
MDEELFVVEQPFLVLVDEPGLSRFKENKLSKWFHLTLERLLLENSATINDTGIVTINIENRRLNNMKFYHQTFAEYYCAECFLAILKEKFGDHSVLNDCKQFLINELFKDHFEVVYLFMYSYIYCSDAEYDLVLTSNWEIVQQSWLIKPDRKDIIRWVLCYGETAKICENENSKQCLKYYVNIIMNLIKLFLKI